MTHRSASFTSRVREESTVPYLGKNHKIEIKILDSQKEKSAEGQKNSVVYKNGRFLFTILSNTKNNQNYNDEIRNYMMIGFTIKQKLFSKKK